MACIFLTIYYTDHLALSPTPLIVCELWLKNPLLEHVSHVVKGDTLQILCSQPSLTANICQSVIFVSCREAAELWVFDIETDSQSERKRAGGAAILTGLSLAPPNVAIFLCMLWSLFVTFGGGCFYSICGFKLCVDVIKMFKRFSSWVSVLFSFIH